MGISVLKVQKTKKLRIDSSGPWFTKAEAARHLGVSKRTIDRLRIRGLLKAHLMTKSTVIRFHKEDMEQAIS